MSVTHLLSSIDSLQKTLQEAQAKEASAVKKYQTAAAELLKKDETIRAVHETVIKERTEVARVKAMQGRVDKENEDLRAILARKDHEIATLNNDLKRLSDMIVIERKDFSSKCCHLASTLLCKGITGWSNSSAYTADEVCGLLREHPDVVKGLHAMSMAKADLAPHRNTTEVHQSDEKTYEEAAPYFRKIFDVLLAASKNELIVKSFTAAGEEFPDAFSKARDLYTQRFQSRSEELERRLSELRAPMDAPTTGGSSPLHNLYSMLDAAIRECEQVGKE